MIMVNIVSIMMIAVLTISVQESLGANNSLHQWLPSGSLLEKNVFFSIGVLSGGNILQHYNRDYYYYCQLLSITIWTKNLSHVCAPSGGPECPEFQMEEEELIEFNGHGRIPAFHLRDHI